MGAWTPPSDRAQPTLEWMTQRIAQECSDAGGFGERQLWHNRRVPVELLAAEEEIGLRGTVLVNKDGVAHERRPNRGMIYEALVRTGLDWLDDALPRYDRKRELDDAVDDADYYPHDLHYRWARNPHLCHREEDLAVYLSTRTLARAAERARRSHLLSHVLVLGSMVAGMAQSEFWLPRRGPLAMSAIRHWLEYLRQRLPGSGYDETGA